MSPDCVRDLAVPGRGVGPRVIGGAGAVDAEESRAVSPRKLQPGRDSRAPPTGGPPPGERPRPAGMGDFVRENVAGERLGRAIGALEHDDAEVAKEAIEQPGKRVRHRLSPGS